MEAAAAGPVPERVVVRMYQVGFGDCFLLSFHYRQALEDGRAERHLLVDFGSTHGPPKTRVSVVERAAALIAEHTSGSLDVIVVTHRHRDHLSGFGDPQAAAVIADLQPRLVVRPWTDEPELERGATAPTTGDSPARFARDLAAGQALSERVAALTQGARASSARGELGRLALDQLPNHKAIEFLDEAARESRGLYLSAGMASGIEELVPGIRVRVLGPPTLEQRPEVARQRANDPDEFWLAHRNALADLSPESLEMGVQSLPPATPGPVAWIVGRLARQQVGSLARVVRTVDDALNNTSLILLIDVGDKRLLLPGDAQIENWEWALKQAPDSQENRALLADVDLYKVGHHGSRNATPKSLFRLWGEEPDPDRPMTALMSTRPGVHGESVATAVPRETLVSALERRTILKRTDKLGGDQAFVAVAAETEGAAPFALVAPEP